MKFWQGWKVSYSGPLQSLSPKFTHYFLIEPSKYIEFLKPLKYPDEAFLGKNFFSKFYKNCSKTQYLYEAFNQPPTKKCISPFDCAKKEGRSLALIRKGRKVGPNHLKLRPGIIDTGTLAFQNHFVSMVL